MHEWGDAGQGRPLDVSGALPAVKPSREARDLRKKRFAIFAFK